jgi:hypothetical protein
VRHLVVFESFLTYSRPQSRAVPSHIQKPPARSFGFALKGRAGEVYNEEAFRHFLGVERTRADRSERTFLLLLVSLRKCPTLGVEVPRAISASLFSGLSLCVREVDFIGWYREERVAGAVLAQGDAPGSDAPARIVERVTTLLSRRLPSTIAERLRVRVVQLGPRVK